MVGDRVPMNPWGRFAYPLLGAALGVVGMVQLVTETPQHPGQPFSFVAALLNAGSVAVMNRRPLIGVLGVSAAVIAMSATLGLPVFATFIGTIIAAFSIGRHLTGRSAVAGVAALVAAATAVAVPEIRSGADSAFNLVYPVAYFGGAALAGRFYRRRAQYLTSIAQYAEALEREQLHLRAIAAAEERTRIARDLHDGVAHGVSLMVVQAEAGREVLAADPERAGRALDAIAAAGREAIADLRRMLGVLRHADALDIAALLAPVRAAGLAVDLDQTGTPAATTPGVHAAAYRIVQEALTNVIKHAHATRVAVQLEYSPDALRVEVVDDGAGAAQAGTAGHGLSGMRERAASIGGNLAAGPRTDGRGYRVCAILPVARPTEVLP